MDCKHAYFKDDIQYVLCDCGGKPQSKKLNEVTKHMCQYQRYCPNIRACALLPEWVNCDKLKREEMPVEVAQPTPKKKSGTKKA